MKMLARAGLALCLALSIAPAAYAATLYTVLVWDPRFPGNAPMRITTTETAAAALVQAGVATPEDAGKYGYLAQLAIGVGPPPATGGQLDFSNAANSALIL